MILQGLMIRRKKIIKRTTTITVEIIHVMHGHFGIVLLGLSII